MKALSLSFHMNLFTRNSPYYHLLKYLLFLLKHPVYIYKPPTTQYPFLVFFNISVTWTWFLLTEICCTKSPTYIIQRPLVVDERSFFIILYIRKRSAKYKRKIVTEELTAVADPCCWRGTAVSAHARAWNLNPPASLLQITFSQFIIVFSLEYKALTCLQIVQHCLLSE